MSGTGNSDHRNVRAAFRSSAAASLVNDTDAIHAPAVGAAGALVMLPAIYAADDVVYSPIAIPSSKTLAPALVTALDHVCG